MANAAQIVAAFRDVASTKSLSPEEMNDLVKDGILAGLARIHGPNVQAEISIDEDTGEFEITVLRRVVDDVEDPSCEIALEEARWDDPTYEVGDVMEIPVNFAEFGRNAVMAVKQRIVQRVRENERDRIRDEFADRVGELLSGEVQQIERGKLVVMLNRQRDADAIIPRERSAALYDVWAGPKTWQVVPATDHNTLSLPDAFWSAVARFLAWTRDRDAPP